MKIKIVFNLSDDARRAIARHYGKTKTAEYDDCKATINMLVETYLEDLIFDMNWEEQHRHKWEKVRAKVRAEYDITVTKGNVKNER